MKTAIIVGYYNDSIAQAQREPFLYNSKLLKQLADLKVKYFNAETFVEIGQICKQQDSEIIFLMPSWKEGLSENQLNQAEKILQEIREKKTHQKLIFIDPFAQANTNFFNLIPYVDSFLKRQCYTDLNNYQQDFSGGTMLTDFLAKNLNIDLNQWYTGSELSDVYMNRINVGWNLATAKKFKTALLKKPLFLFGKQTKNHDVFCRLSLGSDEPLDWYKQYRLIALNALKSLETDYKVITSGRYETNLVSRDQYLKEIKSSRIVFSPFGWGETCWRDFEAVCYDCLLIKPSMDHIRTEPNIYIDGETYVSVKWNFSDLVEKCQYFLRNPDEAARIITNARQVYTKYFQENQFVEKIKSLIE